MNAELAAFVEQARRDRPLAWAAVERLQRACLSCPPVTPQGSLHALDVLRISHREAVAPTSGA
ncbi:MAG: hypothetical protein ABI281_08205 [Caldimonas sp.]